MFGFKTKGRLQSTSAQLSFLKFTTQFVGKVTKVMIRLGIGIVFISAILNTFVLICTEEFAMLPKLTVIPPNRKLHHIKYI